MVWSSNKRDDGKKIGKSWWKLKQRSNLPNYKERNILSMTVLLVRRNKKQKFFVGEDVKFLDNETAHRPDLKIIEPL